ncbi:hypothetical protein [Aeromicrobium stalagmiti]|uniref:hypothetical protein n=1 Tax=Aeromicrobium stalagmiti TaxID=2738988 RepID=UPI00156A35CB|nr:hypothetical protein [Aeromicrobium stalagmiti]NRQ50421.1 hypothetical protein [Aeromicrobium stalagmiti]
MAQEPAVRRITTADEARLLAARLLETGRAKPVVVVASVDGDEPLLDPAVVQDGVGTYADVYWMPNGDVTWAFTAAMPPLTQVYGDAGRVYSVDNSWHDDARKSRLHLFATAHRAKGVQDELIAEAMHAAAAAGLFARKATGLREVTATVKGFLSAGRAYVRGDFGIGYVRGEMTVKDVPLESVLRAGMIVKGLFDDRDKLLDISDWLCSPDEALATYEVGEVVPVRVRTVGTSKVTVELYPGKHVDIGAGQVTGNHGDDLHGLFTPGEVAEARVERTGRWILSMHDIHVGEVARAACALVDGGPPWIEIPPEPSPDRPDSAELPLEVAPAMVPPMPLAASVAPPAPAAVDEPQKVVFPSPMLLDPRRRHQARPPVTAQQVAPLVEPSTPVLSPDSRIVAGQREELGRMRVIVEQLEVERETLLGRIEKYKTEKRKLLARARRPIGDQGLAPRGGFLDAKEQLRHEVYLAWVERIPAGEKAARPLPMSWAMGPDFIASLAERPKEVRPKVVSVMVEVLLDIVRESSGRDLHRLRSDAGGDAPHVERAPGEFCWRCAVQQHTPGAPRLHYWKAGTAIEFSRVVHHDDMTP